MNNRTFLLLPVVFTSIFIFAAEDLSGQSADSMKNSVEVMSTESDSAERNTSGKPEILDKTIHLSKNGRNCTPVARTNPYAISRKDFMQLPADRQKFILAHPDRYAIID